MKNSKKIKENGKKVRIGKQYAAQGADGESFEVSGGETRIFSSLAELLSGAFSSEKDIKSIAYVAVRSIALGFIAFFFGRTSLLLDTYTLGISLLAASGSSVIPIFIGALVSAFAVKGGQGVLFSSKIYVCAYVLVLFIRIASRVLIDPAENFSAKTLLSPEKRKGALYALYSSLFGENVYLRMTSACAAAFFVSLWVLIEGEYRYYDLFSAMFAMISAPAITFLMSGFWREVRDKTDRFLLWVAEGTMLTAIVLSAKSTAVFGVNVGIFVAFLAILFFTERRGVLFSSALGLFMGLAFSPIYSPAFILAAVGAFVMKSSRFAICSVASLVALLWVAYIDGIRAFTLFLPALITASVVFYALKAPASFSASDFAERRSYVETKGLVLEDASIKIEMLEHTFASIAKDLYAITERRRYPSFAAVSAVTRECFEERCSYCKMKRACRGEISDLVSKMSEIILRDGRIKKDSLPSFALDSCSHIMEIAEEANLNYGRLMVRHLESEKTRLFAVDYEGFSHILADVAEQVKRENTIDAELTERLRALCGRGGLGMEKIYVYGDRKKKIYCGNI